jgi:hypothetical protein
LGNSSEFFVDGVIENLVAIPPLIENKVLFLTYFRSNDTINQVVTIKFGIKISDAIAQQGKIHFTVPSFGMFAIPGSNPVVTLDNSKTVLNSSFSKYPGLDQISEFTLENVCSSFLQGCFGGMTLEISISNILNPPFIINSTQ